MSDVETGRIVLWQILARLLAANVPDARRQRFMRRLETQLDLAFRTRANRTRRERSVPNIEELAAANALRQWATRHVQRLPPTEAKVVLLLMSDIPTSISFVNGQPRLNQDWESCVKLSGYAAVALIVQRESPALLCSK